MAPLDPLDAAMTVLREEGQPLHWTVIQDLALRRGYLDPFTDPDVRGRLLKALSRAAGEGKLERPAKGFYAIP